jgi:ribosome biogenesis protein UTP30
MAPTKSSISSSVGQAPPPLFKPASVKPRELAAIPSIDSLPVNTQQCDKALKALLAHVAKVQEKRQEDDLLGEQDEKLYLVVGLKKPSKRQVHKPIRL